MTDGSRASTIVVLGATGYVGGRLVPRLLAEGHRVRCFARRPATLAQRSWGDQVEIVGGDLADGDHAALDRALQGSDVVFHLVHSMTDGDDFSELDRRIAANVADACERAGVTQLVYLGGLGDEHADQSAHLSSRHEVGRVLAGGATPVTELRAAVILGSGSASFEMLRALVERLPAMIVPKWVNQTRCQPTAISDVIDALAGVVGRPETYGQVLDLGGPDVLTYRQMMDGYAEVAQLRPRRIIGVPVLTPRLSSWWVNLVTPLPLKLARALVMSLASDVVVRPDHALAARHPAVRLGYKEAIERALGAETPDEATRWSDAALAWRPEVPRPEDPEWAGAARYEDLRRRATPASSAAVFDVLRTLGGRTGWYGPSWMWELRGLMDKAAGGFGLRRGRRSGTELRVGDAVDFWRVAALEPGERLVLQAEMKLPGAAWLWWELESAGDGGSAGTTIVQRATYLPRGVLGRAYWWAVFPFHFVVFPRLLRRICERAEEAAPHRSDAAGQDATGAGEPAGVGAGRTPTTAYAAEA